MKTCIHCGRPKEKHAPETFICPGSGGAEGQTFATRDLPPGRMCADCHHFTRTCEWLLSYKGTETACDWWPVRFVPIVPPEAA
jgi:hypothetical protein